MAPMIRRLWPRLLMVVAVIASVLALSFAQGAAAPGLRNATVLIVRHAEKPALGPQLNARGEARAAAYADYFTSLQLEGEALTPQRLIATADSAQSIRPRQTLIPLAQRLQLPIEQPFANNDVDKLVSLLRKDNQAKTVLIAWHHGHINKLIGAFGGNGPALIGQPKWPVDVYDWLIVLRFDDKGQLVESRSEKVQEQLMPGDMAASPGR
ncbi:MULTISPECIES: flagellar basal body-associated protein FliL [unclassified Pseudomonas]|uniref:flagellar basal body-associated protein FliL n=1 Tax=unclassified Pseudomonas TaxID=196821 RepID=UPI001913532B|nr:MULTISPECIES: flagellar basal body-associated protein FliL [unclassified Pseudomonas]MBK5377389.1 flagellar basal body-associated protein FliL [Pseudomonas sp. TH43]MBK5509190.1 flagellar basal body-associated protein FliL [Pseudomonas sp. TH15]